MGVVQWAWSSGCGPVGVSQDECRTQGKSEVWSGREWWVWSCGGLVGVV